MSLSLDEEEFSTAPVSQLDLFRETNFFYLHTPGSVREEGDTQKLNLNMDLNV